MLKDPKTFEEFLRRAHWGPWVLVAILAAVLTVLFLVAVVFERDPTNHMAPIDAEGKRLFAIAILVMLIGAVCVAPFWSRNIRILARRGRRVEGRIVLYAPLPKGGARLVTIEYLVADKPFRAHRDVPNADLEQLLETGLTLLYDPEKPSRMLVLPPEIARLPLR